MYQMLTAKPHSLNTPKPLIYKELRENLSSILLDEKNPLANLSTMASLLFYTLPEINWAGFYLFDGKELVVGPYQGKPACIRIPIGKGVCGKAVEKSEPQIVENVNLFPGHIACDADSKSEIVIPLFWNEQCIGVLDIDSPILSRFNQEDLEGLQVLCDILLKHSDWTTL